MALPLRLIRPARLSPAARASDALPLPPAARRRQRRGGPPKAPLRGADGVELPGARAAAAPWLVLFGVSTRCGAPVKRGRDCGVFAAGDALAAGDGLIGVGALTGWFS